MTAIIGALKSQYRAGLTMLERAITEASDATLQSTVGAFAYWQIAYHTLHSADLYLARDETAFRPQPFHREGHERLGAPFWDPTLVPPVLEPYSRAELLAYVDICRQKLDGALASEDETSLAGPSGFVWIEMSRLELYLYSIRHLQHHTGQLVAALRAAQDVGIQWVFGGTEEAAEM